MKKFFTITLLLLVMAANAMAQDNKRQLLDQCRGKLPIYENLRQYGEYLLNPQSLDDAAAVELGCAILDNLNTLQESINLSSEQSLTFKTKKLGLIIAILKTMPADIELRQTFGKEGVVFFNNCKVFVPKIGPNIRWSLYGSDEHIYFAYCAYGFLYDPFGESGLGNIIKAEDSKKDYFPKSFLTTDDRGGFACFDDVEENRGGDYVIGSGLLFNLQNIDGTELFFDWLDKNNNIAYDDTKFKEKLKILKDPDYNVYAEVPMRSVHWNPADEDTYIKRASAILEKHNKAIAAKVKAQEAAEYAEQWGPYEKKYGAAFKRAHKGGVWIGMPVDLVELFYRRVKKTQSFGGTVEIYVGYGKRIWVTNGKVSKIVSK